MTSKRILLVDDNPLDIELTCLALSDQGFDQSVQVAADGQEALEILQRTRPDDLPSLMLLDLHMPRMDGQALLHHLKSVPQWRGIRVVILTTSSDLGDREASLHGGADGYVQKSMTLGAFIQSMREVVRTWLTPVEGGNGASPGEFSGAAERA
jgi:CheY-like chemotaxis protein